MLKEGLRQNLSNARPQQTKLIKVYLICDNTAQHNRIINVLKAIFEVAG